jgi:hypothetical protein
MEGVVEYDIVMELLLKFFNRRARGRELGRERVDKQGQLIKLQLAVVGYSTHFVETVVNGFVHLIVATRNGNTGSG